MKHRLWKGAGPVVACAVVLACGGPNPSTTPTSPVSTPAPIATPTPAPTPTPSAIACNNPSPPPLYAFRVKVHSDMGYKKVLDSRVLVGRDQKYCEALGYPGDICVVRDENAVDAVTCNNLVAGTASQTGRYGPNWYWNDQPCRPAGEGGDAPGCKQHPTNQFMVFVFGPGNFSACGDGDRVCSGMSIKYK